MFFTLNDYVKIKEWLLRDSIKDSEFPEAMDLQGDEEIPIILNGLNAKVSLEELHKFVSTISQTLSLINITEDYEVKAIPLYEAIELIPIPLRRLGLIITFLDENSNWAIYQFLGDNLSQWSILDLWIDIIKQTILEGKAIADGEDLVSVVTPSNTVIKFKDKVYNSDSYSGLGRVYLRKNLLEIDDSHSMHKRITNLLTLSMVNKENTIYIVLYDYDLNGQRIIIPDGCVLKFEGGKFSNGTVMLNSTMVSSYSNVIENCIDTNIKGNFAVGQCLFDTASGKPKWWNGETWVDFSGNSIEDVE